MNPLVKRIVTSNFLFQLKDCQIFITAVLYFNNKNDFSILAGKNSKSTKKYQQCQMKIFNEGAD